MTCIGACSMRADHEVLHLRSSAGLYGVAYVVLGLIQVAAGLGGRLLCLDNRHLAARPLWRRAEALGVPQLRRRVLERYALTRRARDCAFVYDSVWKAPHGDACP